MSADAAPKPGERVPSTLRGHDESIATLGERRDFQPLVVSWLARMGICGFSFVGWERYFLRCSEDSWRRLSNLSRYLGTPLIEIV